MPKYNLKKKRLPHSVKQAWRKVKGLSWEKTITKNSNSKWELRTTIKGKEFHAAAELRSEYISTGKPSYWPTN